MVVSNVLTAWLADRFPEQDPLGFYRDLFPSGHLASSKSERGKYSGVIIRVFEDQFGTEKAERHFVFDQLENVSHVINVSRTVRGIGREVDLLSPLSYAGRRPRLDRAHELFALVFDLDGLRVDGGTPVGLEDLFYQMESTPERPPLLPIPTYAVSSGTGLHLYYMLDQPLPVWPNVLERLRLFRIAFTHRLWNRYVTELADEVQLESVVQSFRMVGTMAKDGEQVVRAFKTGGRITMDELNMYVPEGSRVTSDLYTAKYTLEEACEKWPDWRPDWRWRAMSAETGMPQWHVKRDLFDWWCRRVEGGEPFVGNRYWCIFVAAAYAAKCCVPYEELEAWAYRVRPVLDSMSKDANNRFTVNDVQDALAAYGNPLSVKLRRDKVSEKTQLPMPVNKRNGRKQDVHLARARVLQSFDDPDGNWRNKNGAPKKARVVREYAYNHPDASHSAIARALGVSRPTVIKWLKPGWREDYERLLAEEEEMRTITPVPIPDDIPVYGDRDAAIGLHPRDFAKVSLRLYNPEGAGNFTYVLVPERNHE